MVFKFQKTKIVTKLCYLTWYTKKQIQYKLIIEQTFQIDLGMAQQQRAVEYIASGNFAPLVKQRLQKIVKTT